MNKHLTSIILIGRPNVGKSTLFNRLIGQRQAIEHHEAQTTRDILRGIVWLGERAVEIVDTAGDIAKVLPGIERDAKQQRETGIIRAAHILFVFDTQVGMTAEDRRVLRRVRQSGKPFTVVGTKAEGSVSLKEYSRQSWGAPFIAVSAIHKIGLDDLLAVLEPYAVPYVEETAGNLVILGRPNAGKSTLFNALAGDAVSIVSEIPGTTRDVVSYLVTWQLKGQTLRLIMHDTAGVARRSKAMQGLNRFATQRLADSLKVGDCALLCLDGTAEPAVQDAKIAETALSAGLALIIVITKWDTPAGRLNDQEAWLTVLRDRFRFALWLPVIFISARAGTNLDELRQLVARGLAARQSRFSDEQLAAFLAAVQKIDERLLVIKGLKQTRSNPPELLLECSELLHESLVRQLINRFRETFAIGPTPIQWELSFPQKRRRSRR